MTQKEAFEILKMGHNAYVGGAAGSGKTHLLNQYISYLRDKDIPVGVTASTGIAATHMGGMTIHSWSGIGVRDELTENDLENLESKSHLWKRIEKARVLIIDEISMLHDFRLDMIERIIRFFKRNDEIFGGLQVIFCGDFFQLPPVSRQGEKEARFAYHSEAWQKLNLKICYLEEQHRQNDSTYLEVLNAIRKNNVSEKIIGRIKSRIGKKPNVAAEPAKLYTHNINVDAENEKELAKLPGEVFEYKSMSRGRASLIEVIKKSCLAPEILRLKQGARVMFVKNSFESGYANGTLGIVENCDDYRISIRTARGKMINVELAKWVIEDNGKILAEISQYPLRLAWAITVHKSQGMSLDAAEIDLSKSFEEGMGYVALSRLRTLGGLSLIGFNDMALRVSEEVLEFDERFREESKRYVRELEAMEFSEISSKQKKFLEKASGERFGKAAKKDTLTETKNLILEGRTINEIAKERELTFGTILGHLEKIKKNEPDFDFSNLREEIPPGRFKIIRSAFLKRGIQSGEYRLSPAKSLLDDSFSFEEMRLVRLFL